MTSAFSFSLLSFTMFASMFPVAVSLSILSFLLLSVSLFFSTALAASCISSVLIGFVSYSSLSSITTFSFTSSVFSSGFSSSFTGTTDGDICEIFSLICSAVRDCPIFISSFIVFLISSLF